MANYHKPESKTIQELKDIATKLRIHSIRSTQVTKSGYVEWLVGISRPHFTLQICTYIML